MPPIARADGGEQAGLEPVRRRHALAFDAVPRQILLDEPDERDVGLAAGRVEGDEPRQQLLRRAGDARHLDRLQFRLRWACGLSRENAGIATLNSSPFSVVI